MLIIKTVRIDLTAIVISLNDHIHMQCGNVSSPIYFTDLIELTRNIKDQLFYSLYDELKVETFL